MLQAEETARPACADSSQVPLALEMRTLPPSGSRDGAPHRRVLRAASGKEGVTFLLLPFLKLLQLKILKAPMHHIWGSVS